MKQSDLSVVPRINMIEQEENSMHTVVHDILYSEYRIII